MPAEQSNASELDPFAFPSETKGRFVLLIIAALALGSNLVYFLMLTTVWENITRSSLAQEAERIINPPSGAAAKARLQDSTQSKLLLEERLAVLHLLAWSALGIGAVPLYRRHPARIYWRHRPSPLTRLKAPGVVADLEGIAERIGLPLPRLEHKPGLAQGHAYGLKGSEALMLSGSPELLEESWKASSRAIALHELAHIANGDAQAREKVRAIWIALLVMLLAFLALAPVFGVPIRNPRTFLFALQLLSMLVLVRWIAAELIRQREFHADWRAASWGAGPALEQHLQLSESEGGWWERSRWWWQAWGRWGDRWWWRVAGRQAWNGCGKRIWRLWRLHPSFAARRRMLADPSKLFRISAAMPWLTGITLGLTLASLYWGLMDFFYFLSDSAYLVASLNVQRSFGLLAMIFSLAGVAYLLTKTMGVQVQREAIADLMLRSGRGWGYAGLAGPALALAGGTEVGLFIAPLSVFTPRNPEGLAIVPLSFTILAFLFWLWLAYTHGSTRLLLGSYVGSAKPGRRRAVVTWTSTLMLAILLWPAARFQLAVGYALLLETDSTIPQSWRLIVKQNFVLELPQTFASLFSALVIFLAWSSVSLALAWVGTLRKRKRCLSCGEESPFRLVLGRCCSRCGESLSAWVFAPDVTTHSGKEHQAMISSRIVELKEARRENRAIAIEIIGLLLFLVGLVPLFWAAALMASVLLERLAPGISPPNIAVLIFQREVGTVEILMLELAFLIPAAALLCAGSGLRRLLRV